MKNGDEQVASFEQMRAEAMFASEQLVVGLKRMATIPDPHNNFLPFPASVAFSALYSSLLPLATAFERLCKIGVIALAVNAGESVPSVRNFGHRVTDLVATLTQRADGFDWQGLQSGMDASQRLAAAADDSWSGAYLELLDQYGAIGGRYEMIDGLARGDDEPADAELIFGSWAALPSTQLSDRQQHLCAVRKLASDLLESGVIPIDDPVGEDALELFRLSFADSRIELVPVSLARALRFQQLGSAIAGVLREASTMGFYKSTGRRSTFPDMFDVLEPGLLLESDSFLGLVVLGFGDEDIALETADSLFPLMFDDDE